MKTDLTISVCIACFNGSRHIENQLRSILKQIEVNDEIIIVDDSSTDDTVSIVNGIGDQRIKLNVNSKNLGAVNSFSLALSMAQGDIIFLSDQDDIWHINKVDCLMDIFYKRRIDLIVHNAKIVKEGRMLQETLFSISNSGNGVRKNIISNTYTGCCMSFRRKILPKVLPIPNKRGLYHDAWIGIISEYSGFNILFLDVPLMDWNRHDSNLSVTKRRNIFVVIHERLLLIFTLVCWKIKNLK